jgi:hypothetical protein
VQGSTAHSSLRGHTGAGPSLPKGFLLRAAHEPTNINPDETWVGNDCVHVRVLA